MIQADFRPALITEYPQATKQYARRTVVLCELDANGQIKRIHNILATRKLTAIQAVD
ncbi:MAG: hypothetical protein M3X11_21785 [Acidobacteriota bacterium]|nr:hypothetical protein [Acidobacteriota bacterium]